MYYKCQVGRGILEGRPCVKMFKASELNTLSIVFTKTSLVGTMHKVGLGDVDIYLMQLL